MANLEAKHLFAYNRFPDNELKKLLVVAYFPFGVILLLLRSVLALFLVIFGQVLPDTQVTQNFLYNLACICFGITVSVDNLKQKENVSVYIGNYLSILDHLAVSKALGFILPLNKTPLQSLPGLGITNLGSINNADSFKKNLEVVLKNKNTSVYLCPEETPTNGRALLKFNSKYFEFFEKVQPVCITVKRPLDIAISTIGSTYINDVLYFMYAPFTNYTIKLLPSLEKKSISTDGFSEIVRENIASELKITASPLSASDLLEWSKRYLAEERRRAQERTNQLSNSFSSASNPELVRMAAQVKEVLPHVPVGTIYNDLNVTRSIDTTITNILEGRIRFVPETPRPSSPTPSTSQQPSTSGCTSSSTPSRQGACTSSTQFNTGASTFGKSANERTKSFKERKEQLIAAARRRYIEKHNLDIPV